MKPKSRLFSHRASLGLAFSITLVLSLLPQAHAVDGTWTTDGSSNWSTTDNWLDGIVADGADATADFSTISITSNRTIQLDTSRTLGSLTFDDILGSSSWTLGNNANPSNILTLAVNAGAPTITVNTASLISAIIDGNNGLTKAGSAAAILSGSNVYSGVTAVNSGTLAIMGNSALGATGVGNQTIVASGATLVMSGNNVLASESLTISGSGVENSGALDLGYRNTWSGGITLAADASIRGDDGSRVTGGVDLGDHQLTISGSVAEVVGDISGIGSLVSRASSAIILSGDNTYTGSTEIQSGTLQFAKTESLYNGDGLSWTKENVSVASGATLALNVGGSGEFSVAQSKYILGELTTAIDNNGLKAGSTFAIDTTNATGATTFDQAITDSTGTGAGSLGFTKLGAGTLVLNQENTYTGATRISGGTLQISGSGTLGNQGDLILNQGNLDLGGSTQTVGAVQSLGSITNGNLVATSYVLDGGHHTAGLGGVGSSMYMNDYYVYLEGVNTYTGRTTIDRTMLGLKKSASLYNADMSKWTKDKISVFGNGAGVIVSVGGTGEFTTAQAKTLLSNLTTSIDNNGLTAGTIFGIDTSNSSGLVIFDQVIADSTGNGAGTLNLSVEGAQALVLNQANTYSGNTSLIGGHLQVGHANAIPSGAGKGVVTTQAWTAGESKMDTNGFDISINALSGDNAIIFNGAIGTHQKITLGSNNPAHSGWFSGQITDNSGTGGTLSLDKIGSSTQALSGDNTYTGATTVRAGELVVDGSISASIHTTVESGATLSGSGAVGALTVEAGGTIAPGNSPGTLYVAGDLTWLAGGNYNWQIVDGLSYRMSEWDSIKISGVLDLAALSAASPFNLNLWSLSQAFPDLSGDVAGFDPTQSYSWTIASAAGGIFGFDADHFAIRTGAANGTAGFSNDLNGGSFSLAVNGDNLDLVYNNVSAAPEPTGLLALAGLLGGGLLTRRRKTDSQINDLPADESCY